MFLFQKPVEDISCVSWNKQVQHILASASPGGKASVWDLRKNDLIIKVSDHSNRVRDFSSPRVPHGEISHNLITALCHLPVLVFRCTALDWPGTQKWRLSWSWHQRTTECPSFRCGTCALLPRLSRFWRITPGKCTYFLFFFLLPRLHRQC